MKGAFQLAVLVAVLVVALIAWRLHPWMPSGRTVRVGKWQIDGQEFQVWQRKNDDLLEAFVTGLFVRQEPNQWRVFCLDIQDCYSSDIELRTNAAQVVVFRGGKKLGDFDTTTAIFKRATDGATVTAVVVSNEPPSDWWIN